VSSGLLLLCHFSAAGSDEHGADLALKIKRTGHQNNFIRIRASENSFDSGSRIFNDSAPNLFAEV
jgi:hypothetical protein